MLVPNRSVHSGSRAMWGTLVALTFVVPMMLLNWHSAVGPNICSTVLCQRPAAPRKLRTFQKEGRSEGKRAAQRRASRAAPLDFWAKTRQKRRSATSCVDPARSRHLRIRSRKVTNIFSLYLIPGRFCDFCFAHFEIFKIRCFPGIFTRRHHQNRIQRTEIALKMRFFPLTLASKMGDTLRMAVADGRHAVAGGVPPAGRTGPGQRGDDATGAAKNSNG